MSDFLQKLREQAVTAWQGMKPAVRGAVIGIPLVLFIGLLVLIASSGSGSYEVLFSNLRPEDAAEVVAVLRDQGVPYRLERSGQDILVPRQDVPGLRLDLAAQGLPRGGVVGFEAFDATRLGMTDFERHVQYQRALQGELTRTIRAFEQVQDARVHITLPERSLFIGQQRDASASVVLQLKPGRTLSATQVQAITHLLARSVEGLKPEHVTVVDTQGNVLSDMVQDTGLSGGDAVARQLSIQQQYQEHLSREVQTVLEHVYGRGNVVARVSVELNFDLLEESSEIFSSPTEGRTGIPRSQQTFEETFYGAAEAVGGVPGVYSNIPGYVGDDGGESGWYERREETINYELNRTVINRQVAPGAVRRLSVAVIVDRDLDDAERRSVEQSVAAVVGLDPSRGDIVSVQSMRFDSTPVAADLAASVPAGGLGITPVILGVLMTLLTAAAVFAVLRRRRGTVGQAIDVVSDEPVEPDFEFAETSEEQRRRRMRAHLQSVAQERPQEVARLLRGWLAED